jgi:UDP-N-acetylmuramyl pentapeptide synthase
MNPHERRNAFTFAEIVVAAPWVAAIVATSQDNDKAVMLQSNTGPDEGSPSTDLLVLESAARRHRAAYLAAAVARLGTWVKSWRQRGPATQG